VISRWHVHNPSQLHAAALLHRQVLQHCIACVCVHAFGRLLTSRVLQRRSKHGEHGGEAAVMQEQVAEVQHEQSHACAGAVDELRRG
jgi:hypothetical protein